MLYSGDTRKVTMAKLKSAGEKRAVARKLAKSSAGKGKSLREANAWLRNNHDSLLAKARRNSVRLTGKPTFGGMARRKSA